MGIGEDGATIVVGGDLRLTEAELSVMPSKAPSAVFNDLRENFRDADLSIVNLEAPLTNFESPIRKSGPSLRAPLESAAAIGSAGIDVACLANNHILDHGAAGLDSTLRACHTAGLATVGAGPDMSEARRISIHNVRGLRVGLMGVTEHEFSCATESSPGANPLDLIDCVRNIRAHSNVVDYLVVLLHGGKEGYPFPSPRLMDTCRFLVEEGANAVICQHSHCVGCFESYRGGHIVYGQGNLLFDWPNPPPGWNEGVLVTLRVTPDRETALDLVPCEQLGAGRGVRRMGSRRAEDLLQRVAERSEQITDQRFVVDQWRELCRQRRDYYFGAVLGHGRILQHAGRLSGLRLLPYSTKALLRMGNVIRCETHREVLETVLEDLL